MKKILFLFGLLLTTHATLIAQDYVREEDRKTGKPILRGKMTFADLMDESTNAWLLEDAQAYAPKPQVVDDLRTLWKNYRFVVFAGTWCEDTRILLPKFYKTIMEANISLYAIELYGVNRKKQSLNEEHKYYKVDRVPTIIVLHQKREVGRIVESVDRSIEEDLLAIIEKDAAELEAKKAASLK